MSVIEHSVAGGVAVAEMCGPSAARVARLGRDQARMGGPVHGQPDEPASQRAGVEGGDDGSARGGVRSRSGGVGRAVGPLVGGAGRARRRSPAPDQAAAQPSPGHSAVPVLGRGGGAEQPGGAGFAPGGAVAQDGAASGRPRVRTRTRCWAVYWRRAASRPSISWIIW